jgi:hypothetical protein
MNDFEIETKEINNFFQNKLELLYKQFGKPTSIGLRIDKPNNCLNLSFNTVEKFQNGTTNYNNMEHKDFAIYYAQKDKIGHNVIWNGIRPLSRYFDLPTVFLEDETGKIDNLITDEVEKLGRWVVKTLRDDTFKSHLRLKEEFVNIRNERKDTNKLISSNLSQNEVQFFSHLTDEQFAIIDRYILSLLDNAAFLFGSYIDEEIMRKEGDIQITVNNKNCEEISKDLIGNGNYSGEYFDWIERFSDFGDFEHSTI